jgi:hypothetical protein
METACSSETLAYSQILFGATTQKCLYPHCHQNLKSYNKSMLPLYWSVRTEILFNYVCINLYLAE